MGAAGTGAGVADGACAAPRATFAAGWEVEVEEEEETDADEAEADAGDGVEPFATAMILNAGALGAAGVSLFLATSGTSGLATMRTYDHRTV